MPVLLICISAEIIPGAPTFPQDTESGVWRTTMGKPGNLLGDTPDLQRRHGLLFISYYFSLKMLCATKILCGTPVKVNPAENWVAIQAKEFGKGNTAL